MLAAMTRNPLFKFVISRTPSRLMDGTGMCTHRAKCVSVRCRDVILIAPPAPGIPAAAMPPSAPRRMTSIGATTPRPSINGLRTLSAMPKMSKGRNHKPRHPIHNGCPSSGRPRVRALRGGRERSAGGGAPGPELGDGDRTNAPEFAQGAAPPDSRPNERQPPHCSTRSLQRSTSSRRIGPLTRLPQVHPDSNRDSGTACRRRSFTTKLGSSPSAR